MPRWERRARRSMIVHALDRRSTARPARPPEPADDRPRLDRGHPPPARPAARHRLLHLVRDRARDRPRLAITLIGIPLLTLVLASVRPLLAAERSLSNSLLGTDIPASTLAPQGEGFLGTLKAYWTDGATWRGMGYLLARFPAGLATFTVAVTAYATAGYLIAAPIIAPFDGIELGFWEPDTVTRASRSSRPA